MEYFEKFEKIRSHLYWTFIIISILDFITTTIGIFQGHSEKNPSMQFFASTPFVFAIIKILVIIFVILLVEGIVITLKKHNEYGKIVQIILFFGLFVGSVYTMVFVIGNICAILFG